MSHLLVLHADGRTDTHGEANDFIFRVFLYTCAKEWKKYREQERLKRTTGRRETWRKPRKQRRKKEGSSL